MALHIHLPKEGVIIKVDKDKRRIIIQSMENLPTLPHFINELVEMVESEKYSAKDLSGLISKDQSISSVILKLVNSAFYGHMSKISSINQAVVILGFNTVKSIALGSSIFGSRGGKHGLYRKKLWTHSLGVATTSRILAQKSGYKDVEEAFIGGLLHDVGKVILDSIFPEEFEKVLQIIERENVFMREAEKEIFDLDHAEASKILLTKWQLPASVANAVSYHHEISKAQPQYADLAAIINIADIICQTLMIGSGGNKKVSLFSKTVLNTLNVSHSEIEGVKREIKKIRDQIELFEIYQ